MVVDSYKWLPPSLKGYFQNMAVPAPAGVPWTAFARPLRQARIAVVTTAGINVRGVEQPFDTAREEREPQWGDPTYRTLPRDVRQDQIEASHLHVNNEDVLRDMNVAFPVGRLAALEHDGVIDSLAERNYSFMGYQPDTAEWRETYAPAVATQLRADGVDGVLLTPV